MLTNSLLKAVTHLMEELPGLVRRESAPGDDEVEQLPPLHILHYHEDVRRCVDHLVSTVKQDIQLVSIHGIAVNRKISYISSEDMQADRQTDTVFSVHVYDCLPR